MFKCFVVFIFFFVKRTHNAPFIWIILTKIDRKKNNWLFCLHSLCWSETKIVFFSLHSFSRFWCLFMHHLSLNFHCLFIILRRKKLFTIRHYSRCLCIRAAFQMFELNVIIPAIVFTSIDELSMCVCGAECSAREDKMPLIIAIAKLTADEYDLQRTWIGKTTNK